MVPLRGQSELEVVELISGFVLLEHNTHGDRQISNETEKKRTTEDVVQQQQQ